MGSWVVPSQRALTSRRPIVFVSDPTTPIPQRVRSCPAGGLEARSEEEVRGMAASRIFEKLKARAVQTVGDIVATERGGAALTAAMRGMQQSRRVFDEKASKLIAAMGLATKADIERVSLKLGKLRKRLQSLTDARE